MKDTKRFNLSEFKKVKDEFDIPGNFTSVRGAYFIPGINKIGFYKANGCMNGAEKDADLRELLTANILDMIGYPHADIIPIYDEEKKRNGCFSVSILKDNESFMETQSTYTPIITVKDFIDKDIKEISELPNIPKKIIEERRKYVTQYLYISALISNTDVKMYNRQIIYNNKTGEYRNSEYYDAGISFIEDRQFPNGKNSENVLSELYKDYAVEIFPLAQEIEKKLTKDKIDELMSDSIYNGFDEKIKQDIVERLNDRINLITRYNHNILEYGIAEPASISVKDINEATKGVDISLKDKASRLFSNLKNKILGDRYDNSR